MEKQKLEEVISFQSAKVYYYIFRKINFKSTTYKIVGGFYECTFAVLEGYSFQNN